MDRVGRDKMVGMLSERVPVLLDKELRLELELGEEVLEMLLLLGEEVLELLLELELLDEEELVELELDEELLELLDEVLLLELALELALELGKVMTVLVEGRPGTLLDALMGAPPLLLVHTPLQATIWPLIH